MVWTSRYLTKHPKLWTFLVSHWVRGPDILQKIQSCGPFSLSHGSEVHDILQSIQNCGPFFPTRGSEVQILRSKIVDLFFCGAWFRGSDIYYNFKTVDLLYVAGSEIQIFHERSKIVDLSLGHMVQRCKFVTKDPESSVDLVVHRWVRGPGIFIKF